MMPNFVSSKQNSRYHEKEIKNRTHGAHGIIRRVNLMRTIIIGPKNGIASVNLPCRINRLHRL